VFHGEREPHRVIALEAGLAMTAADQRFDNALALVRAEARSLGEERVAVVAADPHPRLVKHFDESLAAMEKRLSAVQAADAPVIREDLLETADSLLAGRENGELVLVAAQPATIADGMVRVLAAGETTGNAFILSAVFVPDSDNPTSGVFHCRVGFTGRQAGSFNVAIIRANESLLEQSAGFEPGEVQEFTTSTIAADGGLLTVAVDGTDMVAGDNRIDFQLPDRRRIRVKPLDGIELPPVLADVIDSLPEAEVGSGNDDAQPVVRVGPDDSVAEIRIRSAEAGDEWLPVRAADHPLLAGMTFEDALCRAPVTPMEESGDTSTLLQADGSPIALLNSEANQLTAAATLFNEEASIVRRTGYAVFWSTMLHHLAGWRDEPLTLTPVQAARSTEAASNDLVLKAGMGNFDLAAGTAAATPGESGDARLPAWQWLIIAALSLMLVEAVLNLRGRIS
jgi:hypothetical protein